MHPNFALWKSKTMMNIIENRPQNSCEDSNGPARCLLVCVEAHLIWPILMLHFSRFRAPLILPLGLATLLSWS